MLVKLSHTLCLESILWGSLTSRSPSTHYKFQDCQINKISSVTSRKLRKVIVRLEYQSGKLFRHAGQRLTVLREKLITPGKHIFETPSQLTSKYKQGQRMIIKREFQLSLNLPSESNICWPHYPTKGKFFSPELLGGKFSFILIHSFTLLYFEGRETPRA